MAIIIFSILFVFVLGGYAFMSLHVNKTFVQCVEAGPTDGITAKELRHKSMYLKNRRMQDCDGNELSPVDYFRVVVNGNCLQKRDIIDKDILIVKRFRTSDVDELKKGKIVLLYLEDTKVHKIREIVSRDGDVLNTCCYNSDGSVHKSSKIHHISQVQGIISYKL